MSEYFIIENRQKRGRDQMLPTSGLALWHVDELGSNNDEQMTIAHHYECSLEQADNRFDLEKGLNNGDPGDLFEAATNARFSDSTAPDSKWWDGTASGLVISGIGESGALMTFHCGIFEEQETDTLHQSSAPELAIPDNDINGIRDNIVFAEEVTLTAIKVLVDIVHTYRGDLKVTLEAPSGASILLHNRSGGRAANLKQVFDFASTPDLRTLIHQPVKGAWTLWVQDLAQVDEGRLNRWELDIQATASAVIELKDLAGENIPDNVAAGIQRSLTAAGAGNVKDIEVSVDITHSYIGDLRVTLISPADTHVELHSRSGGGADNIIRTYSRSTTPALASLIDEPVEGQWKLHVADLAGRDVGKLNQWVLKIVR
jgi:subtilisin-like proprotein convertase family protein